jgi:hypothetical protein
MDMQRGQLHHEVGVDAVLDENAPRALSWEMYEHLTPAEARKKTPKGFAKSNWLKRVRGHLLQFHRLPQASLPVIYCPVKDCKDKRPKKPRVAQVQGESKPIVAHGKGWDLLQCDSKPPVDIVVCNGNLGKLESKAAASKVQCEINLVKLDKDKRHKKPRVAQVQGESKLIVAHGKEWELLQCDSKPPVDIVVCNSNFGKLESKVAAAKVQPFLQLTDIALSFLLCRQYENEHPADFKKRLEEKADIFASLVGDNILDEFVKTTPAHKQANTATKEQLRKKAMMDQWIALIAIRNSEPTKYSILKRNLNDDYSMGVDKFPTDLDSTVDILINHNKFFTRPRPPPGKPSPALKSKTTEDDIPMHEGATTSFAQCFKCGSHDHLGPDCKQTKPADEWYATKAMKHYEEQTEKDKKEKDNKEQLDEIRMDDGQTSPTSDSSPERRTSFR